MLGPSRFSHDFLLSRFSLTIFSTPTFKNFYIRDTLRGHTKPNRVSWALWSIPPFIGTAAALTSGADIWPTMLTLLIGVMSLLVFLVSFHNSQSYWQITRFDLICGSFSLLALLVWGVADSPRLALLLAIVADIFASLPTILKTWRHSETETGLTYAMALLSVIMILPSIPVWNIENCSFQIWLLVLNITLCICAYRKKLWR